MNCQRISSNPLSFSWTWERSQVFTRKAWRLSVKAIANAIERMENGITEQGEPRVMLRVQTPDGAAESISAIREGIALVGQACRLGGLRWWIRCPICSEKVYALYHADGRLACSKCQRLKYVTKTVSDSARLMNHYADLAESLKKRPGPKPKRFWRYVSREDQYCRLYLQDLATFGEELRRRQTVKR